MNIVTFIAEFMQGIGYYLLAIGIEVIALVWGIFRFFHYKKARIFTPLVIVISGTFISAFLLFLKIEIYSTIKNGMIPFFIAIHNSIRLFVVDFELGAFLEDNSEAISLYPFFDIYLSFLFVCAPFLTFTVVLSFIQDAVSQIRLTFHFICDRYVFSELNERSIALAESIYQHNHRRRIIFANVIIETDEQNDELFERAKRIRAICFKKDISCINFVKTMGKLYFFAINQLDTDNVKIATQIRNIYGKRSNTRLYIFSSSVEAEMFATSIKKEEKIEIRRINSRRSVVYNKLYEMLNERKSDENKKDLFTSAIMKDGEKVISVIIIGLGEYGTEMLKALTWFCQMDGYKLKINAFDIQSSAEKQLKVTCPELLDEKHNRTYNDGDAQYDITIHSGIDVESEEFINQLNCITDVTYTFISLGSDKTNISVATHLRMLFERNEKHPIIHTVVYNSDKAKILKEYKCFGKEAYDIDYVGDIKTIYSEEVIINSKLEKQALNAHIHWCRNIKDTSENIVDSFYKHEYNYRSSMAAVLHLNALVVNGVRGKEVYENIEQLSKLEHKRWNAYMRAEGYIYSPNNEKKHIKKVHPNLVPFEKLSAKDKEKDHIPLSVLDDVK